MFVTVFVGVFVVLGLWLFFREDDNPLDKLPGPPQLPIIGNMLELANINPDDALGVLVAYTKKYGERYTFRVPGQRILHIAGPKDIEVILSNSKNIKKSLVYRFLSGWLGTGLLLTSGAHWHKRRKILTPTFHFNILKNFSTVMNEKCKDLIQLLKDKKGEDVDIIPIISDYTLFTICETAMGTKLDQDQSSSTMDYKNAISNIGQILVNRLSKLWLWNDFIFKQTAQGKEFLKFFDTVRSFADKVILDKKASRQQSKTEELSAADVDFGTKKRMAMLDLVLEAEEKGEIDIQGIRDEVNTFMFAGHDTTALAITFGLMLLADYEDIQQRIFEEVQTIVGDSDRTITISDLADMKYLEAVIKEVLRIYPSVPIIGREVIEDFKMGDLLVKKGTIVDIHIYEMHHREDLFPDPQAFKPERFLGSGEMKHPYAYVPFSAGPRNCIGQRYAMQEMKYTFSEIIRNFKLAPKVKGARPRLTASMVLRPLDKIYVKFLPR